MTIHCTMYIRRQVSSRAASQLTAPYQRAAAKCSVVENMSRSSVPASRSIKVDDYLAAACLLPNLQLLGGAANIEKQDGLPAEWMDTAFPSENKRATYLAEDDLDGLLARLGRLHLVLRAAQAASPGPPARRSGNDTGSTGGRRSRSPRSRGEQ